MSRYYVKDSVTGEKIGFIEADVYYEPRHESSWADFMAVADIKDGVIVSYIAGPRAFASGRVDFNAKRIYRNPELPPLILEQAA